MSFFQESKLSPEEINAYNEYFKLIPKSQPNIVSGIEAVQFFAKSGLSNEILSQIWETADEKNLGYLTPETFAIALKLISCVQNNIKAVEPLFSTVTPLPIFKGVQLTNSKQNSTNSQPISPNDRKKYQSIYQSQHPTANGLPAAAAKALFARSKLPNNQLNQIWNLANIRKSGFLDETEFVIAMHYVAKLMDKSITQLPSILPTDVYLSASGTPSTHFVSSPVMSPSLQSKAKRIDTIGNIAFSPAPPSAAVPWDITRQEKAEYDGFFNRLDVSHKGIINGSQAVGFFKNSKLSDSDLAKIWDLADIGSTGTLNPNEFAIAMHLIKKRSTGEPLPMVLPKSLQPPKIESTSPLQQRRISSPIQRGANLPASPLHHGFSSVSPQPIDEDLLGDFGNDNQLADETSKVNLLHNQIASTKKSTADVLAQKKTATQNLAVLQKNNADLKNQVTHIQEQTNIEQLALTEIQATLEKEKPTWDTLKSDFEDAETQLRTAQEALAKVKQEYKNGQIENERLRRSVHNIQMETMRLTKELDELHTTNQKKQEAAAARRKAKEEKRAAAELKRQQEEEAARKAEEERLRLEEEARKAEEERLRLEEEARKAEEERLRLEEEARKAEEERKQLEEEVARKAEEERKRLEEEEAARIAAEAERKRIEEEEASRKIEEERKRNEEEVERKRLEEEVERKRLEEEAESKRLEEEAERKRLEEEVERKRLEEEAESKRLEEEAESKRLEEEAERKRLEEEAELKRLEEEESQRKRLEDEEASRKAEEESNRLEKEEASRKAEEERKRIEEEEAARKAEEERMHEEAKRKRLEEEEAQRKRLEEEETERKRIEEEEAARLSAEEERKKLEEEAARKTEEQRKLLEDQESARVAAEVEASRKAEEERKRIEEEEVAQKAEEERKRFEKEAARELEEEEGKRLEEKKAAQKAEEERKKLEEEEASRKVTEAQNNVSKDANKSQEINDISTKDIEGNLDQKQDRQEKNDELDIKKLAAESSALGITAIGVHNEEDTFTDNTDTEDFYDAAESTPLSRSVQKSETNDEEKETYERKNSEESEFVIVNHPSEIANTNKSVAPEKIKSKPDHEELTPFDAVFGVDAPTEPEEDPVLVSSLSGSEISDPFTTSTSSSTHRVGPPPPPQSRKSRTPPASETPVIKQKQQKKPPAPPPTKSTASESQDFDAIFGLPASINNNNGGLDENEFDAVFNVTPAAEKAVPTADLAFKEHVNEADFDNAFNVPSTNTLQNNVFQGFQDSFDQSSVTPVDRHVERDVNTSTPVDQSVINASPTHVEPTRVITPTITEKHASTTPPAAERSTHDHQGASNNTRGVNEQSKIQPKKEGPHKTEIDNDGKKKKKKKNIMSFAKNIGFKKKKDKKHEIKTSGSRENVSVAKHNLSIPTTPTTATTSFSASNNSSGIDRSHRDSNSVAYDIDTIQGSHIAELVNMGFEPAAALEALDRYDQDLELATNFLLDQAYR